MEWPKNPVLRSPVWFSCSSISRWFLEHPATVSDQFRFKDLIFIPNSLYFLTSLTILLVCFLGPQPFYPWYFSHAHVSNVSKLVASDSSPLHYLCSSLPFIFTVSVSVPFWLFLSLLSIKIDRTKLLSLGFSCFMCWRKNSTKLLLVLCF